MDLSFNSAQAISLVFWCLWLGVAVLYAASLYRLYRAREDGPSKVVDLASKHVFRMLKVAFGLALLSVAWALFPVNMNGGATNAAAATYQERQISTRRNNAQAETPAITVETPEITRSIDVYHARLETAKARLRAEIEAPQDSQQ